ncbi:alpha/beta hydrolase family protein [Anatilimnocola sp. NA78]|uniref:alpha/beta hydrolase family protein n=1 Tax=Anatilimnocola sp. NA78 TaxID=3415683 RepID=UPI003CE48472
MNTEIVSPNGPASTAGRWFAGVNLTRRFVLGLAAAGLTSHSWLEYAGAAEAYLPQAGENHVGFRKLKVTYTGSDKTERERAVLLWYPTPAAAQLHSYRGQVGFVAPDAEVVAAKHPLVVFSHGYLGSADQSIFLLEGLARRGYVVAAINHADGLLNKREKPITIPNFANAASWNEDKFRDRREDVVALLDLLLVENQKAGSGLHQRIDSAAIGAAGHSLGGYTSLGLIGAWEKSREPRIKAAAVLSPYTLPYHTQGNIADVTAPVLFQGGTLDWGITPLIPGVYKKLAGPKYYVVLKNETHLGWTNLISLGKTTTECVSGGNAELMLGFTAAFFDRHLRGSKECPLLDAKHERLSSYEFAVK